MAYIFMDESGDLGFNFSKKKTSKCFIVSFLFINSDLKRKQTEKIVKKIFKSFTPKEVKFHGGTLHAHKEKPKVRNKVLTMLSSLDVSLMYICLNKKNVYTSLHDEMHLLYNYVTNILLDRISKKKILSKNAKIHLIASQRETNKFLNRNFKGYLEKQAKNKHSLNVQVQIKPFYSEKCLQIVDFASWAFFRYREFGDNSYRNLISKLLIEENDLFP